MFEILMNGVGDAFSRKHWGTNFICRKGDFLMAVDCPDSYRRALKENAFEHGGGPLDADQLDALFITHLHGDHVNGLEMLLAWCRYVREKVLDVYTTPEVAEVLWDHRLAVSLGSSFDGEKYIELSLEDFCRLHTVPWGEPTPVGPFTLETRRTIHHVPTAGVRVHDGEHTLGYAGDTAFDPAHIEWLSDADLIIHETSMGPAHTPLFELENLPGALREKLLVVHYPDALDPSMSELVFARQGDVYVVGD